MIMKRRHSLRMTCLRFCGRFQAKGDPATPDSSAYTINTPAVSLLKYNCYHLQAKPGGLRDPQPESLTLKTFFSISSPQKTKLLLSFNRFAFIGLLKVVVVLFNRQDIFLRQKVVKFLSLPLATFPKNIESFPQKVRSVEMKDLLQFPRQQLFHCRVFEVEER